MAADNYTIGGSLNFGSVPGVNDYQSAYANALSLNQQNYANILSGYQGTLAAQIADQAPIEQGYNSLTGQVLQDIQNVGASQLQAIQDTYAQQSGQTAQDLTNRGLGNTTVAQSVQRGLQLDQQKAQVALANQMAQLTAGYRSQLGSQALNYQAQAAQQNAAQRNAQLGFMNSVQAPYPDATKYANAALQAQTLALARQAANRGTGGLVSGGGGAKPSGGGGFAGLGAFDSNPTVQQGGGIGGGTQGSRSPYDPNNGQSLTTTGAAGTTGDGMTANPALAANGLDQNGNYVGSDVLNQYGQPNAWSYGPGNMNDQTSAYALNQYGQPSAWSYGPSASDQQQASLGQPGVANSLYDAQGNPIAGVAGDAGQTYQAGYGGGGVSSGGYGNPTQSDLQNYGADVQGDGAPTQEEIMNYGGY